MSPKIDVSFKNIIISKFNNNLYITNLMVILKITLILEDTREHMGDV